MQPVSGNQLLKIPEATASSICAHYDPRQSVQEMLDGEQTPVNLINQLIDSKYWNDLVVFLAHALPVRESIWWACCCLSLRDDWNEDELAALHAAKAWVNQPDETSRRFAEKMAKAADLQTAPGWVAQAAFWSGGSMIDADQPSVAPPAFLYAQAVAGAINLAACLPDGSEAHKRYPRYIEIGLNIAGGGSGSQLPDGGN